MRSGKKICRVNKGGFISETLKLQISPIVLVNYINTVLRGVPQNLIEYLGQT